jgi:hypothetical protein
LGTHKGGGHPQAEGPRWWRRTEPVRTTLRLAELEDLQTISTAWGVPVATVAWALIHDQLARCRRQAPELGEHGFAIAAGLRVLRQWPKADDVPAEVAELGPELEQPAELGEDGAGLKGLD